MNELLVSVSLIAVLFLLLAGGVWVGIALLGVAIIGMLFYTTRPIGDPMAITVWHHASGWTLTALPLFIWMGEILLRSNLTREMFSGLAPWIRKIPGRLVHVNTLGCTIFAAACGSSVATCATIGKITIPELRKRGYPDNIVVGSLAGPATIGLLIPPSITMIVYGVTADVSITRLFMAGSIPGLILATMFIAYTIVWAAFNKDKMPAMPDKTSLKEKIYKSLNLLPILVLVTVIITSIYSGIATPTEAAAVGVVSSLALSLIDRSFSWDNFISGVRSAASLYAMIALILAGSGFLTLAMGFVGLPRYLAEGITALNLSPLVFIMILVLLYAVLGCFLEGVSLIVLTIAILLPTLQVMDIDLLWFGIFIVIIVEMAQITPPVGINLFVLKSLSGIDIGKVSWYTLPYFLIMLSLVFIIYAFPNLVMWLPSILS